MKAQIPDEWPPELVSDERAPDGEGWWNWYVLKRENAGTVLIGLIGLRGSPEVSGELQLGCAFLPSFQNMGYGTEAVDSMAHWALSQAGVTTVFAETPLKNQNAQSILRKLYFTQVGCDTPTLLRFAKQKNTRAG